MFKKKKKQPTDDEILDFWHLGDDTAFIANYFRVEEAGIANRLAGLLDLERLVARAA